MKNFNNYIFLVRRGLSGNLHPGRHRFRHGGHSAGRRSCGATTLRGSEPRLVTGGPDFMAIAAGKSHTFQPARLLSGQVL